MIDELKTFKEDMNAWVIQIRKEVAELKDLQQVIDETVDNVQHNYELIYELKDEIEYLKAEINAMKLIQIISLKNETIASR